MAIVLQNTGKYPEAEAYYRKAIGADRTVGNPNDVARGLHNLADLLQTQGGNRLTEAKQLAEEALAMQQTLDPAAAYIWNTYTTLANIAHQQGDPTTARAYRRQARQSYAAFAGSQHQLQQMEPVIEMFAAAARDQAVREQLEPMLEQITAAIGSDAENLVNIIRRIWHGERDEEGLCEDLHHGAALIVGAVLQRLG